jgi:hypothetical protein
MPTWLIVVVSVIGLGFVSWLGGTLTEYFGKKMIDKTQGDKPKSALQRFFGW